MSVVAKVKCAFNDKPHDYPKAQYNQLSFYAVYSDEPGSENKAFSDATPSLNLSMTIMDGKPAQSYFEAGQEYYLTFSKVN